jgi:hypothetical protein
MGCTCLNEESYSRTEIFGVALSNPASYSGSPGLESQPGNRLS